MASPISLTPVSTVDPLLINSAGPFKIVPDSATPSDSPIEAWTQNLSKTTPQTLTREVLPDITTPDNSDAPIGLTPTSAAPMLYYFKKLHRSVTAPRGSKKPDVSVSRKKKTNSKISDEKQRLITAMLGIVPLGISRNSQQFSEFRK